MKLKLEVQEISLKYRLISREISHFSGPGGRYPAPADWVAVIHYMVTGNQNGTSQSVDVVFSRSPDHYNFRRFQMALVGLPEEEHLEIQVDVTNKVC